MPTEREVIEVAKRLKKEGWQQSHGKGSHALFRKNGSLISVPTSKKELPIGTYRNIAKKAGWL